MTCPASQHITKAINILIRVSRRRSAFPLHLLTCGPLTMICSVLESLRCTFISSSLIHLTRLPPFLVLSSRTSTTIIASTANKERALPCQKPFQKTSMLPLHYLGLCYQSSLSRAIAVLQQAFLAVRSQTPA